MRKMVVNFMLCMAVIGCRGQQKADTIPVAENVESPFEFRKNPNGLIYSPQDMNALHFVIDSLNLKFKSCDLDKNYFAYPQAKLNAVSFSSKGDDLRRLIKSIGSGVSFNALVAENRALIESCDSNIIAINVSRANDSEQQFLTGSASTGFETADLLSSKTAIKKGKWYYEYYKKDKYRKENLLDAIYLEDEFAINQIPTKYARLIQYVDCMVDTASRIFIGDDSESIAYGRYGTDAPSYKALILYVNHKMKIEKKTGENLFDYMDPEKLNFIRDSLQGDSFVIQKINESADYCLKTHGGNDELETLVEHFISKQKALEIKRGRRVMGQCSQDESPRIHAWNIAMLAAETHSWNIFMRAHLDIMNDRFERMSDGSYAYGKRLTYLKELEMLDINVIDMMLGLCLRSQSTADNHYHGTVWRIGRALCDSKDRPLFEERSKDMMKDTSLDQFNRSLIFLLYHAYLSYLPDVSESKLKLQALKKEINNYPGFIREGIAKMELK